MYSMIPMVRAVDMPSDVEEYCIQKEFSLHYQSDVVQLHLDGNPFSTWMTGMGYKFTHADHKRGWALVGIEAS